MVLLTVSIVNYHSTTLDQCLDSIITATKNIPTEIFIIDNSNNLHDKQPAKIIKPIKNLGYGKANNLAIKQAQGKYVLIINPDVILERDTIKKLIDYLARNTKVNICAPQLLNNNGSIQESARPFPTLTNQIKRRLGLAKTNTPTNTEPHKVDWVSGACMLLKGKHYFDDRYFLYFEDVDLCRTTGEVHYVPTTRATHIGQYASKKINKALIYHTISMIKYYWKWGLR